MRFRLRELGGPVALLNRQCASYSASQAKGAPHVVSSVSSITFLVVILVLYLINMLPLDGRAKQIARVVVIIIGMISLLKYLAVF